MPWLIWFSGVVPSAFSLDYFYGGITRATGRFVYTIVQGKCFFTVLDQEAGQYSGLQSVPFSMSGLTAEGILLSTSAVPLTAGVSEADDIQNYSGFSVKLNCLFGEFHLSFKDMAPN